MRHWGVRYEFGPFRLDGSAHTLLRDGVTVPMPPKLFDVLRVLVEARGATVPKERFMAEVWADTAVEDGSLTRSISRLRSILGDGPGDERFIVTVSRRGYRFAAPVQDLAPDAPAAAPTPVLTAAAPATPVPATLPSSVPRRRVTWRAAAGMLGAVIVVALAVARYPARATPRSLAVLPFQGLAEDPSGAALGLGLADSLITRLANDNAVTVRPTSAIHAFAGPSVDPVAAGRALAVDAVVEGTVRRIGETYRVNIRLIEVASGAPSWGHTFDEGSLNLIAVEDRLAERVAESLSLALRPASRSEAGTTKPDAYEAYLRGRFLSFQLSKESFTLSQRYLNQAITLDPGFARAHAALAYLHVNTVDLVAPPREAFAVARVAVTRALALDPRLAEAHVTLAMIDWQHAWDFVAAERGFRTALDLDPTSAFVRSQYAFFLASMGRGAESIAESERARATDPLTVDIGVTNALTFLWARRFPEAAERSARVMNTDPNYWLAAVVHGRALEHHGDYEGAIGAYRRALRLAGAMPEAAMDLGRAQARAGHRADALATLRDLEQFGQREYAAPFQLAVILAALGERDRAFQELDRAIDARSWYMTWLKVDPSLDPLRADPRFDERLRRVGFTK
jgi:DNA-binding winged helix-turn-helix (wHTH) protein/TolB-like protein/Flp pilus assembly protein TadD